MFSKKKLNQVSNEEYDGDYYNDRHREVKIIIFLIVSFIYILGFITGLIVKLF